jgi:hypothetical protein
MAPYMRSIQAMLKAMADNDVFHLVGAGGPLSGTTGTGFGVAGLGSTYTDKETGVKYINEGSRESPYWTPVTFDQRGLLGWYSDFRDGVGKPVANTDATLIIPGSGLRVHGQGIAETDSGLTVDFVEGGPVASLLTTDELLHLAAISVGDDTPVFQPDTHGPLVVDAIVAMETALTLRRFFLGFLGTVADALDPPVTGATTVLTLVQDDLAGLFYDSIMTAATRLFAPHNKSDEAATLATTAAGVDTGVDFPAAGTYVRLRVEISAAGVMTCFINKAQVSQIAAALDVDEEVSPCLLVGANATAITTMLVKQFATWGKRA